MSDPINRSKLRKTGLIALGLFGAMTLYFLVYFFAFKPSLPPLDPEGERYMSKLKREDWKGISAMHASRGNGEAAVERWKEIRKEFGPVRSYRYEGAFTRTFPLFTRGAMAYTVQTDKGEIFALLDMKARWGFWKVRETQASFQPPQPFARNRP